MADGITATGCQKGGVVEANDWPNCTDPTNLDTWPTKHEVMERLHLSEKTVERRIADGTLIKQFRPIPGRKPLPILHPEKVRDLSLTILEPVMEEMSSVPTVTKKPRDEMTLSPAALTDIAKTVITETVTELAASSPWALQHKLYLSLDEAALLSGLPRSYLLRRVKEGVIPAAKIKGWRIRRVDLEHYNAVTDRVEIVLRDETVSAMESPRHVNGL
jgi:excisionase family DNA binding protein